MADPHFKSNRRWLYDGWNVVAEFSGPSETNIVCLTRLNIFIWGLDLSNCSRFRHEFADPDLNGVKASHNWQNLCISFLEDNPSVFSGSGDRN